MQLLHVCFPCDWCKNIVCELSTTDCTVKYQPLCEFCHYLKSDLNNWSKNLETKLKRRDIQALRDLLYYNSEPLLQVIGKRCPIFQKFLNFTDEITDFEFPDIIYLTLINPIPRRISLKAYNLLVEYCQLYRNGRQAINLSASYD